MIRRTLCLFAVVLFFVGLLPAEETQEEWQPPPPMPDTFDWVQLNSDEWLKGKIIVLYEDTLEFDSKELDELSIDFGDIKQIRSAVTLQVGLLGGEVAVGKLHLDGDTVRVLGEQDQSFEKSQVLSITVGPPKEINYWDFSLSLGANYRAGNTEQTEATSEAKVRRRTVKSRIVVDWLATYNITDDDEVADNQRLSGTWDLFISKRFFITPVFAEWYRDPFQNISSRYTLSVAAGYDIMDTPKIDWQVSGGPGYTYTEFDDVAEDEPADDAAPAFIFGTTYEHKFTKKIDFLFDYRGTLTNETSGKYLHHLLTSLEFELTNVLDFDITWVWDRIEEPRANSDGTFPEQDDYRLSFMLGVDF